MPAYPPLQPDSYPIPGGGRRPGTPRMAFDARPRARDADTALGRLRERLSALLNAAEMPEIDDLIDDVIAEQDDTAEDRRRRARDNEIASDRRLLTMSRDSALLAARVRHAGALPADNSPALDAMFPCGAHIKVR